MISSIQAKAFSAVPYLEGSALMKSHPKGIRFSTTKPNVLVGPNGAGKSALLKALALYTLSDITGETSFDNDFVHGPDASKFWSKVGSSWSNDYAFLQGLQCTSDYGSALYYRPGHIPGNAPTITHAMMTGYFDEAKAYAQLVEDKSSGQQSQAVLNKLIRLMEGEAMDLAPKYGHWTFGKVKKDLNFGNRAYRGESEFKAELLKATYSDPAPSSIPVILMDEPEQSLDARAELMLWRQIEKANSSKVQVIVATHSLYPLLRPNAFNVIEAQPGYAKEVCALLE